MPVGTGSSRLIYPTKVVDIHSYILPLLNPCDLYLAYDIDIIKVKRLYLSVFEGAMALFHIYSSGFT